MKKTYKNKIKTFFLYTASAVFFASFAAGCQQQVYNIPLDIPRPSVPTEIKNLRADDAEQYSVRKSLILQNEESFETITDQEKRYFYVNQPLQVKWLSETTIQVISYAMRPVKDVRIWMNIPEYQEDIYLMHIQELPALSQQVYTVPFSKGVTEYQTRSGKWVSAFFDSVSQNNIKYSITSLDPWYQKIAGMRPHWKVTFGNYSGGNWREINALYAREWIIMITNMATVFDSDEMRYLFTFDNYPKSNNNGKHFHTDSGYYYSSQADYEALLTQIYNKEHFNVGVTAIGGGLGGGATLGVDTWVFYSHYYGSNSEDSALIAHEMGHGLGFGHSSSFCYGEFQAYVQDLYGLLLRTEALPYTDDSVNGFYKEENTQYRYNGVAQDYRQKRKGLNSIEKFIIANSGLFTRDAEILKQYQ